MTDTPKHSVSVAGVVLNEFGQVLIVQRADNGHWEPPGGVLELGETLDEGVRREVLEETGIVIAVERLTGVYKNMRQGVVAIVFRCGATGGMANETTESRVVEWTDVKHVKQLMAPAFAVRVLDALDDNVFIHFRAHDGENVIEPTF